MLPFPHVLGLLDKVVQKSDKAGMACCPCHQDNTPSLAWKVGETGILLMQCHASGCKADVGRICDRIGVPLSRLRGEYLFGWEEKMSEDRKFVCGYPYYDENGVLKYEHVRWEPKSFSWRRPNPAFSADHAVSRDNPKWLWNMEGTEWILYRMPEVFTARDENPERMVFLVDGEKAVDFLTAKGLIATTCGTLSQWHMVTEHAKSLLDGANIVVVGDNDPAGETDARDVANDLLKRAKTVHVIRPATQEKGGIDDWWQDRAEVVKDDAIIKQELRAMAISPETLWVGQEHDEGAKKESPKPPAPSKNGKPNLIPRSLLAIMDAMPQVSVAENVHEWRRDILVEVCDLVAGSSPIRPEDAIHFAARLCRGLEELPEFAKIRAIAAPTGD